MEWIEEVNVEPFRILCPACSTKLVVRQAELVGRTVPCPKCKSAIHVVRTGEVAWNPGNVSSGGESEGELQGAELQRGQDRDAVGLNEW